MDSDKLKQIYNLANDIKYHKLLDVESSHLLYNSDKELGDELNFKVDSGNTLARYAGLPYVSPKINGSKISFTDKIDKKRCGFLLDVLDNDSVVLTDSKGNVVSEDLYDTFIESLTRKVRKMDEAYAKLRIHTRERYGLDLDKIIQKYSEAWNYLAEKKNVVSRELKKNPYIICKMVWDYTTSKDELSTDDFINTNFLKPIVDESDNSYIIDPWLLILIMLGALPRPGKNEGAEIDNEEDFTKVIDFIEKATADNGYFQMLPEVKDVREKFESGDLELTRISLIEIVFDAFKAYNDIFSEEVFAANNDEMVADYRAKISAYDFQGIWEDNKGGTTFWSIRQLANTYVLAKMMFSSSDRIVRFIRYTMTLFGLDSQGQGWITISNPQIFLEQMCGKLVETADIPLYQITVHCPTLTLKEKKDGKKRTPETIELSLDEGEDLLKIKELRRCHDFEKYKKMWDAYEHEDLFSYSFFSRLTAVFDGHIYIGSYKHRGRGYEFYYRINKNNGIISGLASCVDFNQPVGIIETTYFSDVPRYFLAFDSAMAYFEVTTREQIDSLGIEITTEKETEALNLLLEQEFDTRENEKNYINPFVFNK